MIRVAVAIGVSAAMVVAVGGCGHTAGSAPSLSGQTLKGARWTLASQRGHWAVVAFQASTCIPCREELPRLVTYAAGHPDVRLVSVGYAETPADFRAFLAPFHISWPALPDRDGSISEPWGVESLPVTVVVDPRGAVAKRFSGAVSAAQLDAVIA